MSKHFASGFHEVTAVSREGSGANRGQSASNSEKLSGEYDSVVPERLIA